MRWRYFLYSFISIVVFLLIWLFIPASYPKVKVKHETIDLNNESIHQIPSVWLHRLKNNSSEFGIRDTLCGLDPDVLFTALEDDEIRKTFLINLYNAYIISELKNFDKDYSDLFARTQFFNSANICIAGTMLSANDIEHDLLRNGRIWWSFGWLKQISKNNFEKHLSTKLDPRIHFALNCGAKSCPPIIIYNVDDLDEQLEYSTFNYLSKNVNLDTTKNTLEVIELLNWFIKDFEGQEGLKTFLKERKIIPRNVNPQIKFTGYDWTLESGVWEDQ